MNYIYIGLFLQLCHKIFLQYGCRNRAIRLVEYPLPGLLAMSSSQYLLYSSSCPFIDRDSLIFFILSIIVSCNGRSFFTSSFFSLLKGEASDEDKETTDRNRKTRTKDDILNLVYGLLRSKFNVLRRRCSFVN